MFILLMVSLSLMSPSQPKDKVLRVTVRHLYVAISQYFIVIIIMTSYSNHNIDCLS